MNYSGPELSLNLDANEALIDAGLELLPLIGASLFAGVSHLGQSYQLTTAQVKVLLLLRAKEHMTVGEIASSLSVSMPAASELVDRLVEAGHLERYGDPLDRRRVLVAATPNARRIGEELRDLRRAQLRRALEQLEPEEGPVFVRALQALVIGLRYGGDEHAQCGMLRAASLSLSDSPIPGKRPVVKTGLVPNAIGDAS